MAEEDTTKQTDRTVWVLIEMYALGAVLHGFDVMRPDGLWAAGGWWITGGILALIGWRWAKVKTWISPRVASTATLAATDFRWWMGSAMLILLVVTFSRFVEEQRWPFSAWGVYDISGAEAQKSTLIEWLQQAQRERDEAKQLAGEAEAQKATLVEWLQSAQHERDDVRQERDQLQKQTGQSPASPLTGSPLLNYPIPGKCPPVNPVAQECAKLARELVEGRDTGFIVGLPDEETRKNIRSAMTGLNCSSAQSQ
jgi:hypothetical protein